MLLSIEDRGRIDHRGEKVGVLLPLPSPHPALPFPSLLSAFPHLYSPLEVRPLIELGSLGKCCKVSHWGVGQSPGRPRISAQFQLKRRPLVALNQSVNQSVNF